MAPSKDDKYTNAKKEMERLIKLEAATTADGGGRGRGPAKPRSPQMDESEAATWVSSYQGSTADVNLGPKEDMIERFAAELGMEFVSLKDYDLETPQAEKARSLLPGAEVREMRVLPLTIEDEGSATPRIIVAIADPSDITISDTLQLQLSGYLVEGVIAREEDIVDAIDKFYGIGEDNLESALGNLDQGGEVNLSQGEQQEIDLKSIANEGPIIKLVNLLLVQAVQERSSDLHIEPLADSLRVRYRVDGVLREIPAPPKSMQVGMLSRIKVMAGMNISESRVPQDGRLRLSIGGKEIDLRVASVPTVHGESVVLRVLDKSQMMVGIRQLGLQKEPLEVLLKEARKPNGIVLVTGPTGSGKTTTLYSVLREIFDPGSKFITTEDPVEYELPGIVQVNINPKVKLTFAACLRSILRQDPDVILVGEVRDVETAQISIQAALTGHMVFSTLHTNSAAATITRLIDMGLEPFLLTATLRAIVGQRLVRTIDQDAREIYIPTEYDLEEFAIRREEVEDIKFYVGRPTADNGFTGYKGRLGIFEVMRITEEIGELVLEASTTDELHALAVHQGMQTMRADGWMKICMGVTTFEEVSKQTPRESEESARAELETARKAMERIEATRRRRAEEDELAVQQEIGGAAGAPAVDTSSPA